MGKEASTTDKKQNPWEARRVERLERITKRDCDKLTPYQKNAGVRYIPIYTPRILYIASDLGKSSGIETSRIRPKV
jgi:hypothetical protein